MAEFEVRDNRRVLRFAGELLAEVSSRRAVPRWTELTVYRLNGAGGYMWARVGRSRMAHRPECSKITWQMTTWADLEDADESQIERVPCPVCQPVTWPQLDPQAVVETTRYQAQIARGPENLVELISRDHASQSHHRLTELPILTRRLVFELCQSDPDFCKYWATVCPVTSTIRP